MTETTELIKTISDIMRFEWKLADVPTYRYFGKGVLAVGLSTEESAKQGVIISLIPEGQPVPSVGDRIKTERSVDDIHLVFPTREQAIAVYEALLPKSTEWIS